MSRHSTAHYFLEGLVDLGVDYIFANLGTDHVSLIEEMARWDKEGRKHPEMILCPHEVVAVHMAGGYALATGRGQAALVHVDAGTANACMAIQNLFRYRLPVMLFAGRAPHTLHGELTGSRDTYVHFVQDPFDIASIVRPYVKWEYSLPSGVVVKEALARASAFAHSDPPGPVYMMLPRETLAEQWDDADMPAYPPARYGSVQAGGVAPAQAEAIAKELMSAENPVAFAAYLGRKPQAVAVLDRLARTCGIRVAEFNSIDLNIPQDSPCFAGSDPLPLLEQADLGLLLDSDVPFVPQYARRANAMKWIQIDIDPLKSDFPMWGFPTDMRIQGDCATILQQVLDVVEARADDTYRRRVSERIASWSGVREASAKRRAAASANKGVAGALNPAFVFATLSGKLSQEDVVLNEAIRNGPVLQEHLTRTRPRSYVGLAGGGLGFSGGMALGLKLAQPDRRIVHVIGDGGFHFSSPDSVYAVAQQYQIPILTVVLDNGGWQAVKSAVQRVYPKGIAAETDQFQSRLTSGRQGEQRDFSAADAPSAPMAKPSASRTNSPMPSTAALQHLMTARPPCCMFTSRGCRIWRQREGKFNEDAGPDFVLGHLVDRDCRDDFRISPGRPREISEQADSHHCRIRGRRRQRHHRARFRAETVRKPWAARDRREQARRRRHRCHRVCRKISA
jgi:acetolactate synthase I/II/III large subunit